MAAIRFHHAFTLMMCAFAGTALFLPERAASGVKNAVAYLFLPVAAPVHRGATWLENRLSPSRPQRDPAAPVSSEDLEVENHNLRVELMSLTTQLEELKKLNTDRVQLGPVRERSVPARVVGLDAGSSQMLQVVIGTPGVSAAEGTPVITARGFVGVVVGEYRGTARIRLTSDVKSRIQGRFSRFVRDEQGNLTPVDLKCPPPLVTGTGEFDAAGGGAGASGTGGSGGTGGGGGGLRVGNLSLRQVQEAGIQPGDWITLDDPDFFPTYQQLQGFLVGRVVAVNKSRVNPLMAEVALEPPSDFRRLREVMLVR